MSQNPQQLSTQDFIRAVPTLLELYTTAQQHGRLEFALGIGMAVLVFKNRYTPQDIEELAKLYLAHTHRTNVIASEGYDKLFELAGLQKEDMKNVLNELIAKHAENSQVRTGTSPDAES